MPQPTHEVISRDDAARAGRVTFFTGQPCKHGHIAPRYVTNAGCLDCLNRHKRLRAKHPFSKDLVPMEAITLWRSRRLDQEQLGQLNAYLQQCIDTFCAHVLPPACKTCDGTRYVPVGAGSGGAWKLCPDCPPTGEFALMAAASSHGNNGNGT